MVAMVTDNGCQKRENDIRPKFLGVTDVCLTSTDLVIFNVQFEYRFGIFLPSCQ